MNLIHLKQAIILSQEKINLNQGGPFAALIVKDNEIISEGWNQVYGTNDPTAHAEIVAIRRACKKLGTFSLAGCEIYSSCEPCPMCLAAIYWARLDALHYAATREDAARSGFDDAFFYEQVCLPSSQRRMKMIHEPSLREEAVRAFRAWERKEDKVKY